MRKFTQEDGIAIQAQQIQIWKIVLNEKVFDIVVNESIVRNKMLSPEDDGYAVWRGTDIDSFIYNYAMKKFDMK
jgi:hypothetical protein